jgi:hypothetical protein
MAQIYRILYCSRNIMPGSLEDKRKEIHRILANSRANNAKLGITGALLYNSGYFAQVLEGPLESVEQTFERIQRDMRHDEVAVLESVFVPERDFPEWSMAFAGAAAEEALACTAFSLPDTLENPSTAATEINALLRTLVVQEEDYAIV